MELTNFAIFFAASWVLIITPGPDIFYVISRGISQGKKAGMLSAAGVTLGILVHTLFAAFGLAVILKTSTMAFLMIKYAGAAYLIYMGFKTFKDRSDLLQTAHALKANDKKIFLQGLLTNVLNPKVALFFLAFLPQFTNPAHGSVSMQMACLGGAYAVSGFIFLAFLGFFSGNIGIWLSKKNNLAHKIQWFSGTLLISLGIRLAFFENR